jgi:hypothetical protein
VLRARAVRIQVGHALGLALLLIFCFFSSRKHRVLFIKKTF